MQINLNNDEVDTYENATGQHVKVFEITVPDGLKYVIPKGSVLAMKLKDSSGTELPSDTRIKMGASEPLDKYPRFVDQKAYSSYYVKTLNEQYNSDENEQMRLDVPKGGLTLEEGEKFNIDIKASEVFDADNSQIQLNGVKELSM